MIILLFPLALCAAEPLDLLNHDGVRAGGWQTTHERLDDGSYEVKSPAWKPWPGFSMSATKPMDVYGYDILAATVSNVDDTPLTVYLTVACDKKNSVTTSANLAANETRTIELKLLRKDEGWKKIDLKGMRTMPWMERIEPPPNLRRAIRFGLSVNRIAKPATYRVSKLELRGSYEPVAIPDPFFPLVDAFGQHKHKQWPGKVQSAEDLRRAAREEKLFPFPGGGTYGGYQGEVAFEKAETFTVQKRDGRWVLADPTGLPFFSFGMNSVNLTNPTPCEEREHWFEDFPRNPSPDAVFVSKTKKRPNHGYYKGRQPWCIDLKKRNFRRKYGEDWQAKVTDRTVARLKSWGVNTVGAWADSQFYAEGHAFTMIIHPWAESIDASDSYWGKFPDVFSPSFAEGISKSLQSLSEEKRNSPWCIGIFIDNELPWGKDLDLATQTLQSPATQPAKLEFVKRLQAKCETIETLNSAWKTEHKSWQSLEISTEKPNSKKAEADLRDFGRHLAEMYFKTCRDLVRKHAPGRLYLGCRFAHNNAIASAAAVKYCDVVSVNLYYPPAMMKNYALPGQKPDAAPLLIGEFHYGARDRGIARGLRGGETQADRARMASEFLEAVADHPGIVGAHWFELYDQPLTGRVKDGENYQVGFVDVTDTPYQEITDAVRQGLIELNAKRYGETLE